MSDAAPQPPPDPKKAGSPPFPLIGVILGALAVGAVVGGFVIAPRMTAGRGAAKPAAHAPGTDAEAASEHEEKDGKHAEKKASLVRLENLIVNPAGSQGTRFLMTTIAIEVPDEKVEARLRDHEVQLRDVVMTALEGRTLEMLTAPGSRDRIKQELAKVVVPIAGSTRVRVYLPQFVIQ